MALPNRLVSRHKVCARVRRVAAKLEWDFGDDVILVNNVNSLILMPGPPCMKPLVPHLGGAKGVANNRGIGQRVRIVRRGKKRNRGTQAVASQNDGIQVFRKKFVYHRFDLLKQINDIFVHKHRLVLQHDLLWFNVQVRPNVAN
jgi:hypothetical protein